MKLMVVFGTRPEVIKLAPVIEAARHLDGIELLSCSTGQHRQMLDQALACFGLQADIDLDLMRENQTLPELTARLIEHLTLTYQQHRPDVVVVQGDTVAVLYRNNEDDLRDIRASVSFDGGLTFPVQADVDDLDLLAPLEMDAGLRQSGGDALRRLAAGSISRRARPTVFGCWGTMRPAISTAPAVATRRRRTCWPTAG